MPPKLKNILLFFFRFHHQDLHSELRLIQTELKEIKEKLENEYSR